MNGRTTRTLELALLILAMQTEKAAEQSIANLTRIEDRHGNALTFTNDEAGRILRAEDGRGRSIDFTYSIPPQPWDNVQLTEVTDQTGRTIRFSYQDPPRGNLTTVTDPLGLVTTFAYNGTAGDSALVIQTLPRGNVPYQQTYGRDPSGWGWRVSSQIDAYGNATRLNFNDATSVTTITDPLGNSGQHTHQDTRLLTGNRDATDLSMSLAYDAQGRRTAVTDRLGDTTQISYHPQSGKVASYTDADGNSTTYNYTAHRQTFTNPANAANVTFTCYDLTRITHADGTHDDFVHDAHGTVTAYTDRAGNTRSYEYDTRGQMTRVTNSMGGTEDYTYNADGTLASTANPDTGLTTYSYDAYKRLSQITRPGGSTVRLTYDLDDRLLTATDELGHTTTYTYDANGNLVAEENPLGQTTVYVYDQVDRLVGRTDPLGNASAYAYDGLDRLVSLTNRNGNETTHTYNSRGWLN